MDVSYNVLDHFGVTWWVILLHGTSGSNWGNLEGPIIFPTNMQQVVLGCIVKVAKKKKKSLTLLINQKIHKIDFFTRLKWLQMPYYLPIAKEEVDSYSFHYISLFYLLDSRSPYVLFNAKIWLICKCLIVIITTISMFHWISLKLNFFFICLSLFVCTQL